MFLVVNSGLKVDAVVNPQLIPIQNQIKYATISQSLPVSLVQSMIINDQDNELDIMEEMVQVFIRAPD